MTRVITLPPENGLRPDGTLLGGWWHDDPEHDRIVCDLCPRECHLKPGDRGFCFVRQNVAGEMVLTTYGRSTGFCIDPIEKKPLNHFHPGTSVLSFGTAGCNLGCKFCQNWDISKSREVERLSELASPEAIALAAEQFDCRSVAFTYNDPVIWAEYAIDAARSCRARGIKTVAVTAGYISPAARAPFFHAMDAANVDLKGFTEDFYYKITYSHLQPVLETLEWLHKETDVWFEITNLVIPNTNDSPDELRRMCEWILQHCGSRVPVHFTAFHPDFRMRDLPNTPHATLLEAYDIARAAGIEYVYVGNVNDVAHQSTYCPKCGQLLIERDWYELGEYHLRGGCCAKCGHAIAGRFDDRPGDWGKRRLPVDMSRFAQAAPLVPTKLVTLNTEGAAMRESQPHSATHDSRGTRHAEVAGGGSGAPPVTPEQERAIFQAANAVVASSVTRHESPIADPQWGGAADLPVMGAFVTLKREGNLRACCGCLGTTMPLHEAVRNAAIRTATEDYRFPPISPTELPYLSVDVNLLYGFQRVAARGAERAGAIEIGRHGIQMRLGQRGALFLPSVPVEQCWDVVTYLRQLCRKAQLPDNAWQDDDAELWTFLSREFGGEFDRSTLAPAASAASDPASVRAAADRTTSGVAPQPPASPGLAFTLGQFHQLCVHARTNIVTLLEGGTPNYYLFGVPDGTVAGVLLTVTLPEPATPLHLLQLSLRPGVPLQTTLFQLCEAAARALRANNIGPALVGKLPVDVTLLDDPAMHGTVAEPDVRGVNTQERVLLIVDQGRSALGFQPDLSAEELLAAVVGQISIQHPTTAAVISLATQTSASKLMFGSQPKAVARADARRAAVAGMFYPSDPTELGDLVTDLLGASRRTTETWPAVMAPHAGLVYSGKLAAAVFNRLEIPDTVIVIGPKHTPYGVDWAVSPHDAWEIPGATLASDPALARQLIAAIPGLELDAEAHRREHAIEVELPFLARLAPRSKVVGIALGRADWEQCRQFAAGLARVLQDLRPRPLLVISSDMNHFANDRENRRLDQIALEAMERLDPEYLLSTVRSHNISMCGVIPAVIVMETLRQLGGLRRYERVGYATSADVSGDTSRVVGYAGMLLE